MLSLNSLKNLKNLDRDDLLTWIGLERKSSTDWIAPAMTALGVGLLVGAGLGLLFATKPGADLRDDLRHRLQGAVDSLPNGVGDASRSAFDPSGPRTQP